MKKTIIALIVIVFALSVLAASASIAFSVQSCCCYEYYYVNKLVSANSEKTVNVAPYATSMNLIVNE